jgi:hypothetical protein
MARIRQRCATIRDILEHFFFHVIAKVFGGTVAQGVFLAYKRWYKRIIGVPERFFLVAQVAQFQSWYSARERFFVFFKNFFALKSPLYVKTGYDS